MESKYLSLISKYLSNALGQENQQDISYQANRVPFESIFVTTTKPTYDRGSNITWERLAEDGPKGKLN